MENYLITRNFKFSLIAIFAGLLFLTSCDNDEDNDSESVENIIDNTVTVDLSEYPISYSFIINYGYDEDSKFYNYDFYLTDGSLTEDNEFNSSTTFYIYSELFSASTNSFTTGTFEYKSYIDAAVDDLSDVEHYFSRAYILRDSNGDGILSDDSEIVEVTGGTIKVSGTSPNYTIMYDLELADNSALNGAYNGSFDIINEINY
ncbi:hypothetical protein [Chondrinema litorale]|uniref:hypothetical protein n=1 Tax=Chondrinema litorale TaxID=2994555 RepID=UPI0025431DDE|nr:hypothetical protein [Chondrinema litorale]UZR98060.1 hypothetical protein OQ292_30000 [Chondrinema litorale]